MARALGVLIGLLWLTGAARAQQYDPKFNLHPGVGFGLPQGRTADFADIGGNLTIGGGYNVTPIFGVVGKLAFQGLPIKQVALKRIGVSDSKSWVYATTGNAYFHLPIKGRFGVYMIGGGGWYHRTTQLTNPTLPLIGICSPGWDHWVEYVGGLVSVGKVLAAQSQDAFGGNFGGGVTYRMGDDNLKYYAESRYHCAPHDRVPTRVIPITFSLRW